MSWQSASICVNVGHFFLWELLGHLFWNLTGRLFSLKGSDCAIFHIFIGTFGCAGQKFQDYFCIWTFSPQQLMRLGWNLARSKAVNGKKDNLKWGITAVMLPPKKGSLMHSLWEALSWTGADTIREKGRRKKRKGHVLLQKKRKRESKQEKMEWGG